MARKPSYDFDLIVIGSGTAGSPAAAIAAANGKKVAVVESSAFGGESPNWGDIPMKALLHAGQLYDEARHGARFGLRSSMVGYNFLSLKAWKDLAVKRTGAGNNRHYYDKQGISTFSGHAHFLSPQEISVARRHISARQFLVATGSDWTMPDIPGLEHTPYYTPKTILDITRPPKSLLILGSDTTAVEYAQFFAIFGTKVFIIEKASRILPNEDPEVGELLARTLHEQKGVTVLTQTRLLSATKDGITNRITYSRGGVQRTVKIDEILVTTGRSPAVDLGLENASVAYTPKGVEVNNHLQTSAKHIYAAGDVLGNKRHAHTALLESRIAAQNLLHPKQQLTPDYSATPRITFTFPGVASVGLSDDDCAKRDMDVKKSIAPLNMTARSNTSDFRDGFVKLIADKNSVIIGATVVAPHASEIIHELTLAVKYSLTAAQLANVPHAFLSWSEAVRIAAARIS